MEAPRLNLEDASKYAFHMFGKESDSRREAEYLHSCGNHEDARDSEERADGYLDAGWEMLEEQPGFRPRDVAKFRKLAQEKWTELYPIRLYESEAE
jgi:hypothetical protein